MFSSMKVFTTLSLLTFAAANPVLLPRACKPNFQGRPLTIWRQPDITDIGVYEWRPVNAVGGHISLVQTPVNTAFAKDEFLVEFTGQPTNTYNIKMVADTAHRLALTAGANGDLSFAVGNGSPSQEFAISCDTCATDEANGEMCTISHPATNTCVTGTHPDQVLTLAKCDRTSKYSLWQGYTV